MKEGLLGGTLVVSPKASPRRLAFMLHAGLDLSRRKIDVCLISDDEVIDEWASPPDADGLRGLAARAAMWGSVVRGVIESMSGARFVHDRLEEHGWDVLIADATKVKGLAPLACKTDQSTAGMGPTAPVFRTV
jgi:transposase